MRGALVLTTQLYFEGDPHSANDPWFEPKRAIALRADDNAGLQGTFDLVLSV